MDRLEIVRRRLQHQRLATGPSPTVEDCVCWFGAMQAQEHAEALWSIGERVAGCTQRDVEAALADGRIVRTHVLRPTWHVVAREDLRWLLRLTAPRVQARTRARHAELGLDDDVLARATATLAAALAPGEPLTRAELATALLDAGVSADGQRLPHILIHAELEAVLSSGPRRGKHHTYLLFDDRVPPGPERTHDEAVAELALRFFSSHGPATARDFGWWSSLTMADVRRGIALAGGRLASEEDEDGLVWWSAAAPRTAPLSPTGAFLIPTYDELSVAYRDQRMVLAPRSPWSEAPRRPIVIDGLTLGGWARRVTARTATIEATLPLRLGAGQRRALEAAVARFGAFLGLPATLETRVLRRP